MFVVLYRDLNLGCHRCFFATAVGKNLQRVEDFADRNLHGNLVWFENLNSEKISTSLVV
jgi:hypothetical protein